MITPQPAILKPARPGGVMAVHDGESSKKGFWYVSG